MEVLSQPSDAEGTPKKVVSRSLDPQLVSIQNAYVERLVDLIDSRCGMSKTPPQVIEAELDHIRSQDPGIGQGINYGQY